MLTRYQLPDIADLRRLGEPHKITITVYAETQPGPDHRDTNLLTAKSAVDAALRTARQRGISPDVEQRLRDRWEQIAGADLWLRPSRSLALFIADDFHEVYVLPNALLTQLQVGAYFDIGQLVRAVTTPQEAFALTLSANGWNLWNATPATRAQELALSGEYAADVAEATNRATVRDRDRVRLGDEDKKALLETYAKRVFDAVETELAQSDPGATKPLFLFATEPLLNLYRARDHQRRLIPVPGAPDALRPDQIDETIRTELSVLNAARSTELANEIGDGVSRGLVATDLADIGRAAVAGAVSTLIYDFTVDVLGRLDDSTGQITYDDDGYDLLSRLAVTVLDKGGEAVAVRPQEIEAGIWNGTAVAGLRFALS
ncbi:hypothetical protein [Mycobacterium sp. SMC-4]|uniref:baeRF11 domain-containing protein n=1 Tax=Mycobacterium sp. SMC-4 TaxID=2857059 RepID=UPI003D02C699